MAWRGSNASERSLSLTLLGAMPRCTLPASKNLTHRSFPELQYPGTSPPLPPGAAARGLHHFPETSPTRRSERLKETRGDDVPDSTGGTWETGNINRSLFALGKVLALQPGPVLQRSLSSCAQLIAQARPGAQSRA